MSVVTRLEIASHVESAFDGSPIERDQLLTCAGEHGARREVMAVLSRLQPRSYRQLRDLWGELADIPVES